MNKVIHYCWFGKNEKSELIAKCIESWKTFFPDYEIVEWNESNFDINCCDYVREAYNAKKWAFVSDYCRILVLFLYGGVYFDTDVQIIKRTSAFEHNCIGFEKKKLLNPGLVLAAEKGNWFCKEMLDAYNRDHFLLDNSFNYKTICDRSTEIFLRKGLKLNNKTQKVLDFVVYSTEYFNPKGTADGEPIITQNTVSIHLFNGSWVSEDYVHSHRNIKSRIYGVVKRLFGARFASWLRRLVNNG